MRKESIELKTLNIDAARAALEKWEKVLDKQQKIVESAKEDYRDIKTFVVWLEKLIKKREKRVSKQTKD